MDALDVAIRDMKKAARVLARWRNFESLMEDERALVKRDAIKRLMDAGAATSASAAEKIVEADTLYMEHRMTQRDAVLRTITAQAAWEAARCRAWAIARQEVPV